MQSSKQTHLIGMVLHLHHKLHNVYAKILEPYGLIPRQFGVLRTGSMGQALSQTKLSQIFMLDKNIVGMMIDALEGRELIQRQQNPKNRRENLIITTDKGEALVAEVESKLLQAQRECCWALSEEEFANLCEYITKINVCSPIEKQ